MFKFILGALVVVGLVGYGVITTDDIRVAGDAVREGVNTVLEAGAEATRGDETIGQRIDGVLNK